MTTTTTYQSLLTHVTDGDYLDISDDYDLIERVLSAYRSGRAARPSPIDRAYYNIVLISHRTGSRIWARDAHIAAALKAMLARHQKDPERLAMAHPDLFRALTCQSRARASAQEVFEMRRSHLSGLDAQAAAVSV